MDHLELLGQMTEAATTAGSVLLEMRGKVLEKTEETRRDFTTNADHRSAEIIMRVLGEKYPDIPLIHEEMTAQGELYEGFIVDPVDGTCNYYHGDDTEWWGVSVAYVYERRSIAGVIFRPTAGAGSAGVLYRAVQGHQAQTLFSQSFSVGNRLLEVSSESVLKRSRIWIDPPGKTEDLPTFWAIRQFLDQNVVLPRTLVCCTMSSMMVASGKADGYILYRPKPCDIAAAGLIVEEAGGKVTDLEGNPWTPYSRSFVATNGKIHDELLSRLKEEVL